MHHTVREGADPEEAAVWCGFGSAEAVADECARLGAGADELPGNWEQFLAALPGWMWAPEPDPVMTGSPSDDARESGSIRSGTRSEAELSDEASAHDEQLYMECRERAYRAALARGASHADAEDAAHDVLLSLLARSQPGSPDAGRSYQPAYFRTAVRRRAGNLTRRQNVEVSLTDEWLDRLAWGMQPSVEADRDPGAGIVELPEPTRSIVRLCGLEGWSSGEVAELLGLSERTVERHRARLRGDRQRLLPP